jgi:hypothetical protein
MKLPNFKRMLGLEAPSSPYRKDQASALTSMQSRQPAYKAVQQRGTAMVGQFQPQLVSTGQDLLDYYKAGPDEGGMNAEDATALRTQDTGYAQAGARLKALGARTGADTGGALAALESGRVASAFPIQQALATKRRAERERFRRGAVTTSGQLAGQGAGIEAQGLQGGQALDSSIFGTAGNLAAADEAQKAATFNRIMSFVQMAGQAAGGASGSGGRSAQAPTGGFLDPSQEGYFDPYGQPGGDGYNYSFKPYFPGRG